jgi:hypothetical protein
VSEAFDPYHRWLGIPPKDQPPHHYRLLGLDLFESDDEVIADAVQRQMAHVRTYQLGPSSAVAQEILNQLGAAKACLLNPEKKAIYDQRLRQAPSAKTAVAAPPAVQPPASFPPPAPAARPPVPTAVPPRPPASTRPWRFAIAVGSGGVLLGLVVGSIFLLGAKKRNAPPEPVPATYPELKGSDRILAAAPGVQPAKRVESKPPAATQPRVKMAQPESPRPSASKPAPSQSAAAAPAKPAPLPAAKVVANVAPPLPSPGLPPPSAAEPVRIAEDDAGTARGVGRLPKPELELVFEPGGVVETAGHLRFVVSGKIVPVMGLGRKTAGRFDGACITLDPLEMGRSPFTVEVLARPGKSIGTAQMFLCWQKGKNRDDRDAFYFARRADGVRVAYPTESGDVKVDWPVDYRPGQWYHLAAVRDREGVYVYVNGEKAFAGKPAIADLPTSAYPFTIGNNTLRHAQYTGDLQFVRLYRAALTPQQIRIRAMLALGGKR